MLLESMQAAGSCSSWRSKEVACTGGRKDWVAQRCSAARASSVEVPKPSWTGLGIELAQVGKKAFEFRRAAFRAARAASFRPAKIHTRHPLALYSSASLGSSSRKVFTTRGHADANLRLPWPTAGTPPRPGPHPPTTRSCTLTLSADQRHPPRRLRKAGSAPSSLPGPETRCPRSDAAPCPRCLCPSPS
jgi:hypothetical protein